MNGTEDATGADAARLPRLGPDRVRFERTGGYLVRALLADGASHQPVDFYRAFPYSAPDDLIAMRDSSGAELGMLAPLAQFPAADRDIVAGGTAAPLLRAAHHNRRRARRALRPVALAGCHRRRSGTLHRAERARQPARSADGRLLLIAVDGNRYRLAPRAELEPRIRRKLEAMF